jgi:hypothetical protein
MGIVTRKRIEIRIERELSRLRMWRNLATSDETVLEDAAAHDRINELLTLWEKQTQEKQTQS